MLLAGKQSLRQFAVSCRPSSATRSSHLTPLGGPCHRSQMSPTLPSRGSLLVGSEGLIGGCVLWSKAPNRRLKTLKKAMLGRAEPALAATARVRTRAELDNDAEVFAAGLIQTWVEDPFEHQAPSNSVRHLAVRLNRESRPRTSDAICGG